MWSFINFNLERWEIISLTLFWRQMKHCVDSEWSFTVYIHRERKMNVIFTLVTLCSLFLESSIKHSPLQRIISIIFSSSWNSDNRIVVYIYFGAIQTQLGNDILERMLYCKSPKSWQCHTFVDTQVHRKRKYCLQYMKYLEKMNDKVIITWNTIWDSVNTI